MRVISKFRDYYDTVQMFGHDEHVIYTRHIEEVKAPLALVELIDKMPYYHNGGFRASPLIVGFCGTLYPAMHIYAGFPEFNRTTDVYAYSLPSLLKILRKLPDKGHRYKNFVREIYKNHWFYGRTKFNLSEMTRSKVLEPIEKLELFFKYKTPIFSVEKTGIRSYSKVKLNPCLKDLDFQRVIDPYQAFQEIDMFLSGVLGIGNPSISTIEDKYMKEQKGFGKYSFKTLPTKRKK